MCLGFTEYFMENFCRQEYSGDERGKMAVFLEFQFK